MGFFRYALYGARTARELHLKEPRTKGFIGETLVRKALKNEKLVLNNIVLGDIKKTQIDHIVINDKGILVIETKNYSGLIKGSGNSRFWTQHINKKQFIFLNPLLQNEYHISFLSHLFPEFKPYFKSLVVFTESSTLNISKEENVIQLGQLSDHMSDLPKVEFSDERQNAFYDLLLKRKTNK